MKKRVVKYIMGSVMLAGFILAYGTIGAYEIDNISNDQASIQGAIGVGLILLGSFGLKLGGVKFD